MTQPLADRDHVHALPDQLARARVAQRMETDGCQVERFGVALHSFVTRLGRRGDPSISQITRALSGALPWPRRSLSCCCSFQCVRRSATAQAGRVIVRSAFSVLGALKRSPPHRQAATNVVDLMAVLKQSLAQTGAAQAETPKKAKAGKKARADQRQRSMLLPVTGGGEKAATAREEEPAKAARRRKAS